MKKKLLKKMYAEFEAKEKALKQRKKDIKKCLKIQKKLGVENPKPIYTQKREVLVNKCEIKHFLYRLAELERKNKARPSRENKTFAQKIEALERWRESGEL